MKILSKEEFEALPVKKKGHGQTNPVNEAIRAMQVGGAMLVTREEWTRKTELQSVGYQLAKQLGIKITIRTLQDNSGWGVMRMS